MDPRLWYEQLLDLIDSLYQIKTPNAMSHELFQGLCRLMPFDAAMFTPINWQTLDLQEGYSYGDFLGNVDYASGIHAPFDPLLFDPSCLTRLNQSVRLSDLSSTRYKTPIVFPYPYALGVVASWRQQPVAAIRFYRHIDDFSDDAVKLLNRLALHIANALYFQDTTIAFEPLRETGLIVFDAKNSLLYKNEAASIMLGGLALETALQTVKEGRTWLKSGKELYRAERVPLSPTSLLNLIAQNGERRSLARKHDNGVLFSARVQNITIITLEPFRRRQAVANRLKHDGLSPREIEVSLGIMRGLSNSNIAKQLFIDEKTVKDHLQRIYAKIHIKTRTELISKMLGLDTELAHHEVPSAPDGLQ